MKKIEFIWRQLLYDTIERRVVNFRQQDLARALAMSSSTVNLALAPLKRLGAVRVGGRGFEVVDAEKILYHWANQRRLEAEVGQRLAVDLPVVEIEGLLPAGAVPTAYTTVRERFGEPPTDYDKVYCYHARPEEVAARFISETGKGKPNLIVLQADQFLEKYRPTPPLGQLFVDLWNLTDWYAKEFAKLVKERMDGLLS